jgi:UDP-glucuronate 4-epimerase
VSSRPVLVTGANGFVGKALCAALAQRGVPTIALDLCFDADWAIPGAAREICDLSEARAVAAAFDVHAPAAVVHGGGISGPMLARDQPHLIHAVNTGGTLNVLEAARLHAVRRVVILSSIAVYGDHGNEAPVAEDAPLLALDPYGASKVAAERTAQSYRASFGMEVVALRIASVYGPGRRAPCLVRALVASATSGEAACISTHIASKRQLLYIGDCVEAICDALHAPKLPQFAYNVASEDHLSEATLASIVRRLLGQVRFTGMEAPRYFDGHIGPLQTIAAQRDFEWKPRTPLVDGITRMGQLLHAGIG